MPDDRAAAALAWAREHVAPTGPPELRERPWSVVARLPTDRGPVWLKATTRHEAALTRLLAEHVGERVLVPLAVDEDRGFLLLPDGGPSVADGAPDEVAGRVADALVAYARLQRTTAPHRAAMLALDVPDASPAALPARAEEALVVTGLARDDPTRAAALRAAAAGWATTLAAAPAADLVTVDHQDLHAENLLGGHRVYDWGDAVVAHPFASLLTALGGLARTLGVPDDDPAVLAARDAYLGVFADLASPAHLVATAEVACRAGVVARALTWHRAVGPAGPRHPFAGAARETLETFDHPSPVAGA